MPGSAGERSKLAVLQGGGRGGAALRSLPFCRDFWERVHVSRSPKKKSNEINENRRGVLKQNETRRDEPNCADSDRTTREAGENEPSGLRKLSVWNLRPRPRGDHRPSEPVSKCLSPVARAGVPRATLCVSQERTKQHMWNGREAGERGVGRGGSPVRDH